MIEYDIDETVEPGVADTSRRRGRRPRVATVFHLGEVTGPVRTLRPRLARLAQHADLLLVLPARDGGLRLLDGLGSITVLPYEPLVLPHSGRELARMTIRLAHEQATFRRFFRSARPDLALIVTATLPAALVAARLERVPTLVYAAELFDPAYGRRTPRRVTRAALARLTASCSDAVIACSDAVARQYACHAHTLTTIYPGVEARSARLRNYDRHRDGPCLATVGSLTRGRGQDLVLHALALLRRRLPEARCLIAGKPHPRAVDLAYERNLRVLADRLGVAPSVSFLGAVDDPTDVYAQADVVINPARFPEPFGRVGPEALVAGRPVVATQVGAIPEVLRNGRDALLVPPDDPEALAGAVVRLWEDDELATRLVNEGRHWVLERYDEQRGVEQFERVVLGALRR